MKEKKNEISLKKRNLYLIVIGAALLILTAIVIITIVAATNGSNTKIERPDDEQVETPNDDDKDKEDEQPTDTKIVFSLPVQNATVKTTYSFWYNSTLNQYGLHKGIDFAAQEGTQVCAAYGGVIESITDDLLHGGRVVIDHGNGLKTVYASIDVNSSLKTGQTVSTGDVIGTVSAAADVMGREYNEGSHLHFETLENNNYINPTAYLDIDEK